MLKDGRGAGLLAKIHGMALSAAEGIDTADAYSQLGIPLDPRTYEDPAFVLKYFSVFSLRLLTNNPRKVRGLEDAGFDVQREALEAQPNEYNHAYLQAKATKLGHMLTAFKEP